MPVTTDLHLFADYFQIYLADPLGDEDFSSAWKAPSALRDRLIVRPRILGFVTGRNMTVPVRVESHDTAPNLSDRLATADHAVCAGISTASGKLIVAGCGEYWPSAFSLNLRQSAYGVTFLSFGLASVRDLAGDDRYELHVWPVAEKPKGEVLVRWAAE